VADTELLPAADTDTRLVADMPARLAASAVALPEVVVVVDLPEAAGVAAATAVAVTGKA
jgi:hypothetical protein